MKKNIKILNIIMMIILVAVTICACGLKNDKNCKTAESIKLETAVLSEVEFKNSDTVTLSQECNNVQIEGTIEAMTAAQKNAYGVSDVSHVVVIEITFDKERTLSYFELNGNVTKVFSTNPEDENYVGSLTDLLDNESGEDAYSKLILSANTKEYKLLTRYTDGHESEITVKISATLATAESE